MIAICRRAPDIEVSVAADPLIAQSKMRLAAGCDPARH
jgi:hypothetical protein